MNDLEKLKLKVFEVAVMYFGAAGRGPKFMEKIEEIFDEAKKEENDKPDQPPEE